MSELFIKKSFVAEFVFSLPNMPSPELLKLIEQLFWNEYIYETNMTFDRYADLKYKITIKSPNDAIKRVAEQINEIIFEKS